jgi:2-dehydropantoate 2-reductase
MRFVMRIAILGSGGVGGYFGGRLAAAGVDVNFLARGAQLEAMRKDGLRIESPAGNAHIQVKATDDPAAIGPVDLVFFCVKLYDTEGALKLLPPLMGPDTLVIPFQNGVESVDILTRAVGKARVAGGTAYLAAVVAEPGLIRHTAMGRIIFGPAQGPAPAVLQELRDTATRAGFEAWLSDRITVEIWSKFVRLTVFSGMTAVTRTSIGPIRQDPDLRAMMETAWHESILVARAKQIPLAATIFNELQESTATLPAQARSSMLEDLERGRRLELPWLSGALVRIAEEVGVDVPTHRTIVALLRPHVFGRKEH